MTTNGLGKSKVTAQLVQSLPGYSINMRIQYSILIRQFSLSKEAYLYWKALKDVNETQGSLYDRQPGSIRGNIKSLTDNELVLGYFDAGVVSEKRAFFSPDDFSKSGYRAPKFLTSCDNYVPVEVLLSGIGAYYAKNGQGLLISEAVGKETRPCSCGPTIAAIAEILARILNLLSGHKMGNGKAKTMNTKDFIFVFFIDRKLR